MAYNPQNPNGQATMANSAPVVIASDQTAIPVTGPLTDTQLRATPVPVSGTVTSTPSGTQTVSGSVSVSNFPATQAVSATDLDIRNLTFATDTVDASGSTLGANSGIDIGDVTINNGSGASAVNIQDGGNSITVDGSVEIGPSNIVSYHLAPSTTSTNLTQIKNSAGKVYGWYIYNNADTSRKINFYDPLSGTPTVGTTTIKFSLVIPSFSGANVSFPFGVDFSNSIWISTTTAILDTDNNPAGGGELNINIFYK